MINGSFILNGAPLFLAGMQANMIYPEHIYGFPDKESYIHRMKVAKSFGYNAVR